jgi:hypothetical protein
MACDAAERQPQEGWRPESASAGPRRVTFFTRHVTEFGADGAATGGHRSRDDAASRLSH